MQFIIEIDKLKRILRRSYVTGEPRLENDAEHSWHLAVMVLLLREYACDPEIDLLRAVEMALVHDLVEIHAGDTFLYDTDGAADKAKREQAAADELFSLLPDDQAAEFVSRWEEFEDGVTLEAKYVRALDRLHPMLLNREALGRTWKEHGVTLDMALDVNIPIVRDGAPSLLEFAREVLLDSQERRYFADTSDEQ